MKASLVVPFAIALFSSSAQAAPTAAKADAAAAATPSEPTSAVVTVGVPPGFRSEIADLGDVKIHYVTGGSGPPLLLIHGWPETWYEWRKMMPLLAKRFTVVAMDLRGIGDSSLEAAGYDKKTLANDAYRLMAKLGYPKATVVGHDWGGPTAYAYAATHRDAVDRVVLVEGSPFGPWMKSVEIAWFFTFLRTPGYAESLLPGREREFLRYFYVNDAYHVVPGAFDDAAIAAYTRSYARTDRMNASYGLYRSIDEDVRDNAELAKKPLTIPFLAISAEKGAGSIGFSNARAVARKVTTVLYHGTGHFIPEERPEALVQTIEDFVDGKAVAADWKP